MATVVRQDDPRLVAIKAELLHGIPELTGYQINRAAFLALVAIKRWDETSKDHDDPIAKVREWMSGDG